jgi:hypothetical protein
MTLNNDLEWTLLLKDPVFLKVESLVLTGVAMVTVKNL